LTVDGGKTPYEYSWNGGTLSGTEANNLGAGTYEVEVKDAAGQTTKAQLTIKEPGPLTANLSTNSPASTRTSRDGVAIVEVERKERKTVSWLKEVTLLKFRMKMVVRPVLLLIPKEKYCQHWIFEI